MSERLGRKFCDRKHANAYNNRLKRENKGLERKLTNTVLKENLKVIESIANPPTIETAGISAVSTQLPIAVMSPQEITPNVSAELNSKKETNQFLENLLGKLQFMSAEWETMVRAGFNFRDCDSIEPLRGCNRNKINYGNYSIIWTSPDKVFITHQKHLLFTSST